MNRRIFFSAFVVGALLVASCGGDDDTEASSETTAVETTMTAAPDGAAEDDEVAPPSGEPIVIGFVTMLDGPLAQPQMGDAAHAAVSYINDSLGGIGGRPLELDECSTDASPESSTQCANQFVADGVPVVFQGLDFGNSASHPILADAGIPIVGQHPFTAPDYQTGYFFSGSQVSYGMGAGVYLRDEVRPEKVTILSYSLPSAAEVREQFLIPAMEAAGAQVSVVEVDYAAPDMSVPVGAAIAEDPDAIIFLLGDADCTKVVNAADQLGYEGMVIAGSCGEFVQDSGAAAEGVYAMSDVYSPDDLSEVPERAVGEVRAYAAAMEEYAPDRELGVFTSFVFAGIMNLYAILEEIGPNGITSESIESALEATDGQPAYMADTYGCATEITPLAPAVCGGNVLMFRAEGGQLVQVSPEFLYGPSLLEE